MHTQIVENDAIGQLVADEIRGRLGHDDLTAVGGGPQPCRAIDGGAEVVAVAKLGLSGVDGHSDPQLDAVRPSLGLQCPLARQRGSSRVARPTEDAEGAVAFTLLS